MSYEKYGLMDIAEERPLRSFLDEVQYLTSPGLKHWYASHFHIDLDLWENQTVLINTIRELESGKIVKSWRKND